MKFTALQKHKKLLAGVLVLFTIFTFAFAPQFAPHAQASPITSGLSCLFGDPAGCVTAGAQAGAAVASNGGVVCAVAGGICTLFVGIIFIPLKLTSLIFGLSGTLLDASIRYTIIGINQHITDLSGINIAWGVIRDLINFSFIFILLYAAVKMILGLGDMKKIIAPMVIAAILINFSLFFAKVIVDTSNIVTLTFYKAIITSCNPANANNLDASSLSGCFNNELKITTLFNVDNSNTAVGGGSAVNTSLVAGINNDFGKAAVISLGGSAFLLVSAFVFAAAAIMLLIRFITIIMLFVFSPVMVIGAFLPGIGKQSNQWWDSMTGQAVFPMIFMLLVWVILRIMSTADFLGLDSSTTASSITQSATIGNTVLNFVIVIGFMVATLVISKSYSDKGGKLGGQVVGKALGFGMGTAGFVGRRTIGAGARSLADSEKLKNAASKSGFGGSLARLSLRSAQGTAKSTFDVRSTKVGGILGKEVVNVGKAGGKGGYDQQVKDAAKKHEDFVKTLGPSEIVTEQTKVDRKAAEDTLGAARKEREQAYRDNNPAAVAAAEEKMRRAREDIAAADKVVGASDKDVAARKKKITDEKDAALAVIDKNSNLADKKDKKSKLEKELAEENEVMAQKIKEATDKATPEITKKEEELAKQKAELEKTLAEGGEGGFLKSDIATKEAELASKRADTEKEVEAIRAAMSERVASKQASLESTKQEIASIESARSAIQTRFDDEASSVKEVKGVADERKKAYIETIAGPDEYNDVLGISYKPGTKRAFFVGPIKRSNRQAAANMRKGKKSIEDSLKDLIKEDQAKEEKKPEAEAPAPTEETPKAEGPKT